MAHWNDNPRVPVWVMHRPHVPNPSVLFLPLGCIWPQGSRGLQSEFSLPYDKYIKLKTSMTNQKMDTNKVIHDSPVAILNF